MRATPSKDLQLQPKIVKKGRRKTGISSFCNRSRCPYTKRLDKANEQTHTFTQEDTHTKPETNICTVTRTTEIKNKPDKVERLQKSTTLCVLFFSLSIRISDSFGIAKTLYNGQSKLFQGSDKPVSTGTVAQRMKIFVSLSESALKKLKSCSTTKTFIIHYTSHIHVVFSSDDRLFYCCVANEVINEIYLCIQMYVEVVYFLDAEVYFIRFSFKGDPI